jgi:O-antigen/teichoic acid export membrane protein
LNRYKKLIKNTALITVGNFASKLLTFFLLPLYTAILTTAEYGVADLMTTTVNLITPFFTLIISEAVMRFALDKECDKNQVLSIGIFVTLLGSVVMLFFSPLIRISSDLKPYYVLFILYYFVTALQSVLSQFVKGIERVTVYASSGVLHTMTFIAFNILFLVALKIGITGYLLSMVLSNAITVVYLILGAKLWRYIIPPKEVSRDLTRKMLQYSVPMIPNSLSWWVSNSSDKYMLTFFCGVAATGVYSVSQRIPSLFATISTIFISSWQISAIDDFGSRESIEFYSKIYRIYSTFNILTLSGLILITKPLARFLFSKSFYDGWQFVPVLLMAFLFQAMSSYLGTIYTSAKKTKMLFISTIISAMANIVLNAILIPILGAQGAAIATFVSYFIIWIIRLFDTKKILKLEIAYKIDITSYLLLMVQVGLVVSNSSFVYLGSCTIFVLLVALNFSIIKEILASVRIRK